MKSINKLVTILMSMLLILSLTACSTNTQSNDANAKDQIKVGIIQVVEHPSLNEIREAIIAVATPSAQAVVSETDIPILFASVLDPIGSGIISNFEKPGGNVSGTSNAVSAETVMELANEITPGIKTLGTIYNPSESNAEWVINSLKDYVAKTDIELIEAPVTSSSEVQQAANSLVSKVDAILIPNDNTVATAMPSVSQTAIKAKIPVYCTADSLVRDGGLATKGINYTELGQDTAKMAVEVLNGKNIGDLPARTMANMNIYINKDTADAIGVTIPEDIMSKALEVIGSK